MRTDTRSVVVALATLPLLVGVAGVRPLSAQNAASLCGFSPDPVAVSRCLAGTRSVNDLAASLAVIHGGASAVPGSASVLGRRFSSTPRIAFSGRLGFGNFDLDTPDRWGSGEDETVTPPVFAVSGAVGLHDGFSIAPTVGGLLAVDLFADVSTIRLNANDEFDDASTAFGFGARIGLLRESFTLPGASVSVARRIGASTELRGEGGSLDADVDATSVRLVVGKEIAGFGFLGGAGWERHTTDWEVVANGSGPTSSITVSENNDSDTETLFFGSVTRTFLVTQVGVEFGWSDEASFASLSLRLTL
ncbi:MAG: hypothetical protein RQ745_13700 [Longimicrobiales bacterium]|nr:hypothetical protein [Longimicrobiales bacterium]